MLAVLLLVMQSAAAEQSVYDGRLRQTEVRIPRIEAAAVRLDGVLDEPVWHQAALLTGFTQYRPVDSRPAADSTEVLVFYAPDAMYFGIRAFEAHGNVVRATLADRDNIDADDKIQILLDTFNDRRRALLFAVNPLGAQEDGEPTEGRAGDAANLPLAAHRTLGGAQHPLGYHEKPQRGRRCQSRFLTRGSGRRPGHRESALCAVVPRKAPLLSRGSRAVRHAQRADLHAAHHRPHRRSQAHREGRTDGSGVYRGGR